MRTAIERHQAFDQLRAKLIALSDEVQELSLACNGEDRNSEHLAEAIADILTAAAQIAETEAGRLYPQTFPPMSQRRFSDVLFGKAVTA
jgi:NTP pyrophosphatase (non-canonical NTP hydrolase)